MNYYYYDSKTMYNLLYVLHRTTEPGMSMYVCDVSLDVSVYTQSNLSTATLMYRVSMERHLDGQRQADTVLARRHM